jgi:proteic killer suppression protein
MIIRFRTRRLQALANDGKAAQRELGKRCADLLRKRLDDLHAADDLAVLRYLPGRCHELSGPRAGQLALDLEHPRRLVFEPLDGGRHEDGGLDWSTVTAVEVIEIVDYH